MIVLKFGGTSVGSAERMHALVNLINSKEKKIVVLSAMSGTTNNLYELSTAIFSKDFVKANFLLEKMEQKYQDVISKLHHSEEHSNLSKNFINDVFSKLRTFIKENYSKADEFEVIAQGEILSTTLFQTYLNEIGMKSVLLFALDYMKTDEKEEPDYSFIRFKLQTIIDSHPKNTLFITQGFICKNSANKIDNLKRGGSDYTATIIGSALNADEIQIWSDIDGMHNNDPRIVKKTKPIAQLSFDEAAELAYFGAKVLHPTCVLPAKLSNTPVRMLNTMDPSALGTLISEKSSGDSIKAVAAKDNITAIKIKSGRMLLAYGFLRAVFEIFERHKTPIDMITTSEVAVSLTVDTTNNLEKIVSELKEFCTVELDENQSIICVVGNFSAAKKGYALEIFEALKTIPIRMISYGGSEHNVSILVDAKYKNECLILLNEKLFKL
jgi:aspartate kinase